METEIWTQDKDVMMETIIEVMGATHIVNPKMGMCVEEA